MNTIIIELGIALSALLALFGGGYGLGHHNASKADAERYAVASNQALTEHLKYIQDSTAKLNAVSAQLEEAKNEQHIEYQTITQTVDKIVDRPIYRNVCLDADGLLLVREAISGLARPADHPGQPAAAVPATPGH